MRCGSCTSKIRNTEASVTTGFTTGSCSKAATPLAVLFEYAATLGLVDLNYVHPAGAREDFRDNWGGDDLAALSRYDGLLAIRLTASGAYVLGLADSYQPTAEATDTRLKVLPNLDVVATGPLPAPDRLVLSAFAEHASDRVWTISAGTLLNALDVGRKLAELTTFLNKRTEHELPDAFTTLVDDIERRAEQLVDLGHARVIECADAATAALIAKDLRSLCRLIGNRHLAIPDGQELKFRKTLLKLRYVMPS